MSKDINKSLINDYVSSIDSSKIAKSKMISDFIDEQNLNEDEIDYLFRALKDKNIRLSEIDFNSPSTSSKKIYSTSDSLNMYLQEIGRYPLLTFEDEKKLSKLIHEGDTEAYDELVNSNLRLVASIAKEYKGKSTLSYQDLIQEGNLGLLRAAQKYDYTRGFKFSTYAVCWIRQSISRAIASKGHAIALPVYIQESLNKIKGISSKLVLRYDRDPTPKEIADESRDEFTEDKVRKLLSYDNSVVSLDKPVNENDSGVSLANFLSNDDNSLLIDNQIEDIRYAINKLSERERSLIIKRYGLYDNSPHTLETLGEEEGVTRERARQLVNRALKKMAEYLKDGSNK